MNVKNTEKEKGTAKITLEISKEEFEQALRERDALKRGASAKKT